MRRLVGATLTLGLLSVGLAGPAQASGSAVRTSAPACSSAPFRADPARQHWFRIPSLVRTGAGTLLAFAERRDTDAGDLGDFDVVVARSSDGGCSWSEYGVVGDDAGNRVSNPVPLVDADTGHVLLLSVISASPGSGGRGRGLHLQTSTDDGRTFTPLLERPVRPAGGYKGGLTGVGHGIQLRRTHPGRLVVPMGYRTAAGLYGAYAIYSDDHGRSWRTGFDEQETGGTVQLIEGTAAELADGTLFVSFRNKALGASSGTTRRYAISSDGGATLDQPFRRLPLKLSSVAGSTLAPTGPNAGQLLFSSPADPVRRRRMTVFVSSTGGRSFSAEYPVDLADTPAAYSDLVQLGGEAIGILYETGTASANERIEFRGIPIAELTRPTPVAAALSYRRSATARSTRPARVLARVRVAGTTSPGGRVTLTFDPARRGARTGSTSVDLTYANRGVRYLTLPRLAAGTYRLKLAYAGTVRISASSRSIGLLRVLPA